MRNTVLKTITLLLLLVFCLFNLSAQESNIKLKIETGYIWNWAQGRINSPAHFLNVKFLNVELKLKTSKNTTIGLRFGTANNTQWILASDPFQFNINNTFDNDGNDVISFVPTFDYYFNKNKFRPYLGVGLGYNFLTTSKRVLIRKPLEIHELNINNQIGFLLRGGLLLDKLTVNEWEFNNIIIVGLEFNYIPKTDVEISSGEIIGTIVNSNIVLSIGYTIGNGKSSK